MADANWKSSLQFHTVRRKRHKTFERRFDGRFARVPIHLFLQVLYNREIFKLIVRQYGVTAANKIDVAN